MRINRVRYKLFFGLLFLSSIILVTMTIVVRTFYADSLKRNEINSHIQASARTREQFDFILGIINRAARVIGSRPEVLAALTATPRPSDRAMNFSMNAYLRSLQEIQPFLGNISIVGAEGQFISSSTALRYAYFERLYQYYALFFNSGGYMNYFVDTYTSNLFPLSVPRDFLTGVWPIYDIWNEKLIGQVYMGLNSSLFQEMFILSPTSANEQIVIVDVHGNIIYTHPAFTVFDSVLAEYPQLITLKEATIEGKVFDRDSFIVMETSQVTGWRLIRIIDLNYITSDTRRAQHLFNVVFILSVFVSLTFSFLMSHMLTRPINLLSHACKRIESGDLSFRVDIRSGDEMGQLGRTFNLVMDRVNANLERELVEQKRQNELKLEVLRSQINPHFLYNTLDSIRFLANLQEIHNIASMSSSLISLLKYNLSSSILATLGEEVESVSNYVKIQKYRYGDIFDFSTEIGAGTEHFVISRFVLQPLVENCIIHGFDNIESNGQIRVSSALEGETLRLEVINNGKELSVENMEKLNLGVKLTGPFSSIGVHNVQERIRLQFAGLSTLTYSRVRGETVATLRFPAMRNHPAQ